MPESNFVQPVRRIITQNDLDIFTASPTRLLITDFIEGLNTAVTGLTSDAEVETDKVRMRDPDIFYTKLFRQLTVC